GRTLITGSMDGTIKLWRTAAEGEVLAQSDRPDSSQYRWALNASLRDLLGTAASGKDAAAGGELPEKSWEEYRRAAALLAGRLAQVPNDPSWFDNEREAIQRAFVARIDQLIHEAARRCPDEAGT